MPISAITGSTGDGKTSYLVSTLQELERKKETRHIIIVGKFDPQYDPADDEPRYDGIVFLKKLNLDIEWIQYLDLTNWQEFKHGSLVIVDEAQKVMPQRKASVTTPQFITDLSEHRHKGLDFVFLTQDPRLLDAWARRLVKHHTHVKRLFGTRFQVKYVWSDKMVDDPRDPKIQRTCTKSLTRISSKTFGVYWSAKDHNIKSSIPKKLIVSILMFFIVPMVGFSLVTRLDLLEDKKEESTQSNQPSLTDMIAPALNRPEEMPEDLEPKKFIDMNLIFRGYLNIFKNTPVDDIRVDLINSNGSITQLNALDLDTEDDLHYYMPTPNKLVLKQGETVRTLYKQIEIVKENKPQSIKFNNPFK